MLSESHPLIRRALRGLALPTVFARVLRDAQGAVSPWRAARDLLHIFLVLRYYPDNYGPCRLWEQERARWPLYYGSSYNAYARRRLRREVQIHDRVAAVHDKHVAWRVLEGHDLPLPRCHGVLAPGPDQRPEAARILAASGCDALIYKPVLGKGGHGIFVARAGAAGPTFHRGDGRIDDRPLALGEEYLVQEMLPQHAGMAAVAPSSLNTIRVMTLLTRRGEVLVVAAAVRFGRGRSVVDNWSSGGMAVGVNLDGGTLMAKALDRTGTTYLHHPDTGIEFAGYAIPHWAEVLEVARRTQRAFDFYRLIGVDVAVTPEGPVVIEVNANPDFVGQEQSCGPLLADPRVLREFAAFDLLFSPAQRKLLKDLPA